jgi:PKD repeat protein
MKLVLVLQRVVKNCTTTNFATGTTVQLTATPANLSDTVFWETSCRNGQITVNNNVSCSVTFSTVNQLTACFTLDETTGTTPLSVQFNASCSAGNIAKYQWDITSDNGTTPANPTSSQPTIVFETAGIYEVSLTVHDAVSNASTATVSKEITVTDPTPTVEDIVDFTIETPTSREIQYGGKSFLTLQLAVMSPDEASHYEWYVHNTTINSTMPIVNPGAVQEITVPKAGDYVVFLVAIQNGNVVTTSKEITLPQLSADFIIEPQAVKPNEPVSFSAIVNEGVSWDWLWWSDQVHSRDESTATASFSEKGRYEVALTVTSENESQSARTTKTVYIGDYEPPTAQVNLPTLFDEGEEPLIFVDASNSTASPSEDNPNAELTGYLWFYKDIDGNEIFLEQHDVQAIIPFPRENKPFQILLRVIDNVGLVSSGDGATGFMQVSQGTGVDAQGSPVETDTTVLGFTGGYYFKLSDFIYINADIDVDLKDRGQVAEVLAVVMTPNPDPSRQFYMREKNNPYLQIWPGAYQEIANLVAIEEVESLGSQINVTALSGTLAENGLDPIPGMYSIWVGYRLETGTIIFNLHPITFEVVP